MLLGMMTHWCMGGCQEYCGDAHTQIERFISAIIIVIILIVVVVVAIFVVAIITMASMVQHTMRRRIATAIDAQLMLIIVHHAAMLVLDDSRGCGNGTGIGTGLQIEQWIVLLWNQRRSPYCLWCSLTAMRKLCDREEKQNKQCKMYVSRVFQIGIKAVEKVE